MSISANVIGGDEFFFADVYAWSIIRGSCPNVGRVFYDAFVDWGKMNDKVEGAREYPVSYNKERFCDIVDELDCMRRTRCLGAEVRDSVDGLIRVVNYSISEKKDIIVKNCDGKVGELIF